jgi:hypothetical protein
MGGPSGGRSDERSGGRSGGRLRRRQQPPGSRLADTGSPAAVCRSGRSGGGRGGGCPHHTLGVPNRTSANASYL